MEMDESLEIKFSHRYKKLMYGDKVCKRLRLLEVVPVNLEDLSPEFIRYDTDDGAYTLPDSGRYMMLIFLKDVSSGSDSNILTTFRKLTPDRLMKYHRNLGKWFDVVFV